MKIPFVDLKAQYKSIQNEIDAAVSAVITETAFVRGKYVSTFEEEYRNAYGVDHCISCANGTDALYIALKALDIGPGDEVITTAFSWISTSETISQTGARVVFADIEPDYFTIDPARIEEKISSKTRAIIPVHMYGQAADMGRIMALADQYKLAVIEDCAQAHFAQSDQKNVGTFGIAGTFSFYPGKNLGAYGDAGAIISNDEDFTKRARMFANHGSLTKHQHEMEGINSRLDGLQAAILSVKLRYIHAWNSQRRLVAERYDSGLRGLPNCRTPLVRDSNEHVYHLYVIRTDQRAEMQAQLKQNGVATGIHYPSSLPFLKAYEYLGHRPEDFPTAFEYQSTILSLPMFPELTEQMIDYVVTLIAQQ